MKDSEIIEQADNHLAYSVNYFNGMQQEMEEARKFARGEHWDAEAEKIYKQQKRIMLTIDRINPRIETLIGEQREARPRITVKGIPAILEAGSNEYRSVGKKAYSIAQVLEGMIKGIEVESGAASAYDTAYEHALQGGLGAWRILTGFDVDGFNQHITIERIANPRSIYLDPDALGYNNTRSANFAIITSEISDDLYEQTYGEKPAVDVDSAWYSGDGQKIIEYFWIEKKKVKRWLLSDNRVIDADDELEDDLKEQGVYIVDRRTVEVPQCMWVTLSYNKIIEKPREFPSRFIPIIPVFGRELLDGTGKLFYRGIIHRAKDAQRAYNFARTQAAETNALQPKAPFIIEERQVSGYQSMWSTANTELHSYLPYKAVENAPPPKREPPAQANQAAVIEAQQAEDDINATTGISKARQGQAPQDASGRAIEIRSDEAAGATYLYYDNLLRSLKKTGVILCDMIPRVYDTQRIVSIIGNDDATDYVQLHIPYMDEKTNEKKKLNDWAAMRYSIDISTGAATKVKKRQLVETLERILVAAPNLWNVVGDLLFRNLDVPGAEALAERMEKMIPAEISGEQKPLSSEQIQKLVMDAVNNYGLQIDEFKAQTERTAKEEKAEIDKLKVLIEASKMEKMESSQQSDSEDIMAQQLAQMIFKQEQAAEQQQPILPEQQALGDMPIPEDLNR